VVLTQGRVLELAMPEICAGSTVPALQSEAGSAARRESILRALKEAKGIVGGPHGAAARLGLKRTTLQARMKKLGIARDYQ
jgi:formate hydrogenlyase transcriptional activator